MQLRKITEVENLKGKYVIVRSSLNIALDDEGKLRDDFRLQRALPTLRYLFEVGARVIIISHIGRASDDTLKPVFNELEKYLPVHWGGLITEAEFGEHRDLMSDGSILMAENLRQYEGEKNKVPVFAQQIATFGDIYVNEGVAVSHRDHASNHGLSLMLPTYAGLNLIEEIDELEKTLKPEKPALFLLGGAKFDTKMPLVEKFLDIYDQVFVGGALANDVFKARGLEIGKSLVSDVSLTGAGILDNPKMIIPIDVIVDGPKGIRTCLPDQVDPEESILDCGPMTIGMLITYIEKSKTVLWNGPFGNYEAGFKESTEVVAKHLAESTAVSVLGGGDTVAAIRTLGLNDQFDFVSTGGGAMLTFLENGTTPVIELLKSK